MRTQPGLSIRKLAWPRKVSETAPSEPAAARRSGVPAMTPVHAACAADAISETMAAAQMKANNPRIARFPSPLEARPSSSLPRERGRVRVGAGALFTREALIHQALQAWSALSGAGEAP